MFGSNFACSKGIFGVWLSVRRAKNSVEISSNTRQNLAVNRVSYIALWWLKTIPIPLENTTFSGIPLVFTGRSVRAFYETNHGAFRSTEEGKGINR